MVMDVMSKEKFSFSVEQGGPYKTEIPMHIGALGFRPCAHTPKTMQFRPAEKKVFPVVFGQWVARIIDSADSTVCGSVASVFFSQKGLLIVVGEHC